MRTDVTSRKDLNWGWKRLSEITARSRLAKVPRTSVLEVYSQTFTYNKQGGLVEFSASLALNKKP